MSSENQNPNIPRLRDPSRHRLKSASTNPLSVLSSSQYMNHNNMRDPRDLQTFPDSSSSPTVSSIKNQGDPLGLAKPSANWATRTRMRKGSAVELGRKFRERIDDEEGKIFMRGGWSFDVDRKVPNYAYSPLVGPDSCSRSGFFLCEAVLVLTSNSVSFPHPLTYLPICLRSSPRDSSTSLDRNMIVLRLLKSVPLPVFPHDVSQTLRPHPPVLERVWRFPGLRRGATLSRTTMSSKAAVLSARFRCRALLLTIIVEANVSLPLFSPRLGSTYRGILRLSPGPLLEHRFDRLTENHHPPHPPTKHRELVSVSISTTKSILLPPPRSLYLLLDLQTRRLRTSRFI